MPFWVFDHGFSRRSSDRVGEDGVGCRREEFKSVEETDAAILLAERFEEHAASVSCDGGKGGGG